MYEKKRECFIKKSEKEYVAVDWGMKDILPLFWDNNIQTQESCYGHIVGDTKSIAWIQVDISDFGNACRLMQEVSFEKPLCILNKESKLAFFNKYDSGQLRKWNTDVISGYTIISSHD